MLLDALVLTLIVGLLAGGRLGRLRDVELRGVGFFLAAAAVRAGVLGMGMAHSPLTPRLGPPLILASYLALLGALWANRRLRPLQLATFGVLLNFLVIAANGGSMPADRALAVRAYGEGALLVRLLDSPNYTLHKAATPRTRLRFLGDVLPLPMLVPRPKWFCPGSAGDVFVTLGACGMLLWGMLGLGRRKQERPSVESQDSRVTVRGEGRAD